MATSSSSRRTGSPDTLLGLGTDKQLYYTSMTQTPTISRPVPSYHATKLTILSQQSQEVSENIYVSGTYQVQFSPTEVRLDVGYMVTLEVEIPGDIAAPLQVTTRRVRKVVGPLSPAGQATRQESFEVPIRKDELIHPLHSTRVFNDGRINLTTKLRLTSDIQSSEASVVRPVALESTALRFNEADGYLEVNTPLPFTNQLTIEMWMRGLPKESFLFYFTDAGRRRRFSAHVPYVDGNVYFDAGADANNNYDRTVKALSPPDDWKTWNHWAFVRDTDQGRMSIYRNGRLWHTATGLTRPMSGCDRLVIGADGDGRWLHGGIISEVRVWSVARAETDIRDNMSIRIPDASPGLIASYALDSFQAGQPIPDRSGAGRNAILRGTVSVVAGPSLYSK